MAQHSKHRLPIAGVIDDDHERDGEAAQKVEGVVTLFHASIFVKICRLKHWRAERTRRARVDHEYRR